MPGGPLLIRRSALAALTVLISAGAGLSGCAKSGTSVAAPTPAGANAARCAALVDALPTTLGGHQSRPVLPPSPYAAAWGKPAIVLRCGVAPATAVDPTAQLFTIEGIDWLPAPSADATTFTTVGRTPTIEVVVPRTYAPEADALAELAPSITKTRPTATP